MEIYSFTSLVRKWVVCQQWRYEKEHPHILYLPGYINDQGLASGYTKKGRTKQKKTKVKEYSFVWNISIHNSNGGNACFLVVCLFGCSSGVEDHVATLALPIHGLVVGVVLPSRIDGGHCWGVPLPSLRHRRNLHGLTAATGSTPSLTSRWPGTNSCS